MEYGDLFSWVGCVMGCGGFEGVRGIGSDLTLLRDFLKHRETRFGIWFGAGSRLDGCLGRIVVGVDLRFCED